MDNLLEVAVFNSLELDEINVRILYQSCLSNEETTEWIYQKDYQYQGLPTAEYLDDLDAQRVKINEKSIRFLYGQLLSVHRGYQKFNIRAGMINYQNHYWTGNAKVYAKFLYMGLAAGILKTMDLVDNRAIIITNEITPTLSIHDIHFHDWWNKNKLEWI